MNCDGILILLYQDKKGENQVEGNVTSLLTEPAIQEAPLYLVSIFIFTKYTFNNISQNTNDEITAIHSKEYHNLKLNGISYCLMTEFVQQHKYES